MAAVEHLVQHPEIPHGTIRVGFTPDEEIGRGVRALRREALRRVCAYTLDGAARGELEDETFCADSMTVTFQGRNTHPGFAHGHAW